MERSCEGTYSTNSLITKCTVSDMPMRYDSEFSYELSVLFNAVFSVRVYSVPLTVLCGGFGDSSLQLELHHDTRFNGT